MRKSLRSLVVAIVSLALTGAAISVAPSASAYAPKPALEVLNLSDQVIDPISDAVFEAVQRSAEDVPYFSFMGFLKENHSEDE